MSDRIRPKPGILDIPLYEGGQSRVPGMGDVVKLSSNENPFGPSEMAIEAFRRGAHQLHRYPSSQHAELRAAIAAVHGLDAERVICGVGSDEIITFLCQTYAAPGDEVVYSQHGFLMYRISALAAGATPVEVPERDRTADPEAILAACTKRTRLVFLANPNNPTGTMLDTETVADLAARLPRGAILVLDGAYAEYVEDFDGGAALVDANENVVMTRTFSKIYGLGGLRVGWGYGPGDIIAALSRVRGPFNLATVQQETAVAALGDQDHVEKCRADNARMRDWLAQALKESGVPSDPSHANFILARFDDAAEAEACDAHLKSQGLIVRRVAAYQLPHCLRITVGDEPSCRRVAYTVAQFKGLR